MDTPRKFWFVLTGAVLALAIIACSCGSLLPTPTPTQPPLPSPTLPPVATIIPEPSPSMAGYWLDKQTSDVHSIEWQSGQYVVTDSASASDTLTITSQSWNNGVLTWTYSVASTGVSVTFTTTSVTDTSLETTWSNSQGDSGSETLERVTSPIPPTLPPSMPPSNTSTNASMAVGKWLDPDTSGTVTTIDMSQQGELAVISVINPSRGVNELTKSTFVGGVLSWEYCPSGMHCITSQMISVTTDTLTASWQWSDGGNSGTTTFTRVP